MIISINIFSKLLKNKEANHSLAKEEFKLIKKPVVLLITVFLTLGLAACNNNKSTVMDNQRTGMVDRNNNVRNVGNGRDDGIDHNGPLTEDYTNNDNSDSDRDRNLFNVNNNRYTNRNVVNNNKNDFNRNAVNKSRKNRINNNDWNISSYRTSMNSNQYPHTSAVLIQDAKYQFIPFGSIQGNWDQYGAPQGITPDQQQSPTTKAPTKAPVQQPVAPPQAVQPNQTQNNNATATGNVSQYVQQVINLTNTQRSKNGLPALKADNQLNGVAQKKSVDMQQKNYFSHTSPTYGSPFDMMRDFGVTYKSAGENIAQGQRTPQEVVTAWMNSEGHRRNILSRDFTHIGVGFEKSGKHWTQMFIGK